MNNRPDHESPDQPEGNESEEAARAAGMAYAAIPVTHAGFSAWQLDAMEKALEAAAGKILAFCRSGTRSTLLWALRRARAGANCDQLSAKAAKAGYALPSLSPMMAASSDERRVGKRSVST